MSRVVKFKPNAGFASRYWLTWARPKNPFQSSYWSLYSFLDDTGSKWLLSLSLLSATAAGVPLPLIAVVFREIIDTFPPPEEELKQAIIQIIGIACAYFCVTFIWTVAWGEIGERISQRLQSKLVRRVVGFDQAFFDVDTVDITTILVADTRTIQRGTSEKVGLFVQSCSYFIATFITGFILNAALTGVLFAAIVPVMLLITWSCSYFISKYSAQASRLLDEATSVAEGAIQCVLTVQAFGIVDKISNKHVELLRRATRQAGKKIIAGALMLALVFWACYSLNALAFYWGSRVGGSSGTIFAVVFLVLDASFVFNQVGPFIQTIAAAAGASSRAFDLLERIDTDINPYSDSGIQLSYHEVGGTITFNKVDFYYPARPAAKVLDDLSLEICSGQSTAIVGLSGSGKSTLAALLLRLYDPSQGQITINGADLRKLHLNTLRSHIAVVEQHPALFSGTIFENIRRGIVDADEMTKEEVRARCIEAARDAHCDFLDNLQDGMETNISESHGLSGGQRQRICLARAFARKPALLILDEPTSALDSNSERNIQEALETFMQKTGATILTIAHRLATIKNYSRIVVMGGGKVLETGSHDELLEKGKHYSGLVEAQRLHPDSESSQETLNIQPVKFKTLVRTDGSEKLELDVETGFDVHKDIPQVTEQLEENKFSTYDLMRFCFHLLRPQKGLLLLGVFAAIVQGCVIIGESVVFGHLINILNTSNDRSILFASIDFYCLMFFVISLIAFTAAAVNGSCFGFTSESFVLCIRDKLLRTILIQDRAWFQDPNHTTTRLMAGMSQDANGIATISGPILQTVFATTSMIISGMILSLVSTPLVTVVALAYIPAILVCGYLRVKMLHLFEQRHSQASNDATTIASEAIRNIKAVSAFGLQKDVLQKYDHALRAPYASSFVLMVMGDLALAFSYSILYFLYPLLYWCGSQQVRSGRYTQEAFFISLPAVIVASQQCGQFFTMAPEFAAAHSAAFHVFNLLESKPSIMAKEGPQDSGTFLEKGADISRHREPSSPTQKCPIESDKSADEVTSSLKANEVSMPPNGAEVIFRDVSFEYPNRPEVEVLQNISLKIRSGQFVAFVGASGAGKSSLIALLERFFDPTSGAIFIDGKDIRREEVGVHRSRIGLVPQEPELFEGSISFNIALGARTGTTLSQSQIQAVCEDCGIHDTIVSLPDGYDTECGSRGSQLSGGQKQRVAVARALIRDPDILLLDEATASLDSHSEKDIQQAISAASGSRTTIMVAHRLSTIQRADCIFVFEKGRLVDQGTHFELIRKQGLYYSMVQAQSLE